jgi:hypothetical protein
MINNLDHYGDILAIPFFILSSYYFYKKKNRTMTEQFLLLFSIIGTIADIIFTLNFYKFI